MCGKSELVLFSLLKKWIFFLVILSNIFFCLLILNNYIQRNVSTFFFLNYYYSVDFKLKCVAFGKKWNNYVPSFDLWTRSLKISYFGYLGIWLRRFPGRILCIENLGSPLSCSKGILQISSYEILLFNESDYKTWQTNLTRTVAANTAFYDNVSNMCNLIVSYSNNNRSNSNMILR